MKNKISAILTVVILVGIIIIAIFGFNVDWSYKNYHLIAMDIGEEFNIADIKEITDEVFPKQRVEIQASGTYEDNLVIKVDEVSKEQKELLNSKINEKYNLEKTIEDMEVNYIPSYRIRDLIRPYILPLSLSGIIVILYMAIRFRKIGIAKVITNVIGLTVLAEALYVALIVITRYPVNRLIMPVGVLIYLSIIIFLTNCFEKQISADVK